MKKEYQKPAVSFESFEFSTSIAACAQQMINSVDPLYCRTGTQSDPNHGCEFTDNGWVLFLSSNVDCYVTPQKDGSIMGLCYHVPTETGRMFIS